jgi:hypothetical protein
MLAAAAVRVLLPAALAALAIQVVRVLLTTITAVLVLLTEAVEVAVRLVIIPPAHKQAAMAAQVLLFFDMQAYLEI